MEQLFLRTLVLYLFLSNISCTKELEFPELHDPIYNDLNSEYKNFEKAIKEERAKLDGLLKVKKTIKPRSLERKINLREIKTSEMNLVRASQKLKYIGIRRDRRRVEARISYKISLRDGHIWPDKNEHERYKINKKLVTAKLNWNERVPKLHKANPNFND